MSDNSCNNCMLLKKGDCFGKAEICEDFRYSPSMSISDKENWPTIMRTNAHANHINYKREQQKLEQLSKEKKQEHLVKATEIKEDINNKIDAKFNEKDSYKEIIEILTSIVNGINPVTGEIFDTKELYDNQELHRITGELDNIAAGRKKPESKNRLNRESGKIFEKLKEWRLEKASEKHLPAYYIFKDKELMAIAEGDICKKEDLLLINGVSDYKYELYGDELFNIISLFFTL